jgi:hypothetical protein
LCLRSGLRFSGFPTKTLYTNLLSPYVLHAPPTFSSRFCYSNNIWWWVKTPKLLIMQFFPLPCYSPPLGPNILFSTLVSNTLSQRYTINVSDQVLDPYKTTGNIILLYNLIFKFRIAKWKKKDSAPKDSKHSLTLICSSFLPEENFDLLRLFQKYLNIFTISKELLSIFIVWLRPA